ncbi:MAG: hypothetical protein Fues2KO_25450 [Fuerstiella sp.]
MFGARATLRVRRRTGGRRDEGRGRFGDCGVVDCVLSLVAGFLRFGGCCGWRSAGGRAGGTD